LLSFYVKHYFYAKCGANLALLEPLPLSQKNSRNQLNNWKNHHCKIVKYCYIVPFQRGHPYYKVTFSLQKGCSYARVITALPYLVMYLYRLSTLHRNSKIHPLSAWYSCKIPQKMIHPSLIIICWIDCLPTNQI